MLRNSDSHKTVNESKLTRAELRSNFLFIVNATGACVIGISKFYRTAIQNIYSIHGTPSEARDRKVSYLPIELFWQHEEFYVHDISLEAVKTYISSKIS